MGQLHQGSPDLFKTRIERPFVVGAIVDLGRCLDLTDAASLGIVRAAFGEFKATFELAKAPMPENEPGERGDADLVKRHRDCAVINFVHELGETKEFPKFDTVRGAFLEGKPLYEGARIMERTHVQLCVRKHASILGYFRPIPGRLGER